METDKNNSRKSTSSIKEPKKKSSSLRFEVEGKETSEKDINEKDNDAQDVNAKGAKAKDASSKNSITKDTKAKDDSSKNSITKDTKAKDASSKNYNTKDTKKKDINEKDDDAHDVNAKGAKAKDASSKNASTKDTKTKDTKTKEGSAKDAKQKGSKKKQPSESILKEPDKKPKDEEEEDKESDIESTSGDLGSYIQFPPKPRRSHLPKQAPVRIRRVYYHDENDAHIKLAGTLDENPRKSAEDDLYSPWDEAVKSMRYASVISGLSMAIALVADVAVNGTEKLTVDRVWLPIQFLRTVMNDKGDTPPNILKFLEHIDVKTKDSGHPHPKEVFSLF